jgi:hypothetical protein
MQGRRRPLTEEGLFADEAQPGDFGRLKRTLEQVHGDARQLQWSVKAPDGSGCSLDPNIHHVTEHPDGTISVSPSIITSTWHGWLKKGVWTKISL